MSSASGLRNPGGAVRGVGATALAVQGVILLLALLPLAKLGHGDLTGAIWLCAALAVVSFVFCGLLRYAWSWLGALVVPIALLVGGGLHWSLFALGLVFGLTWLYVLYVRRSVFANKPS